MNYSYNKQNKTIFKDAIIFSVVALFLELVFFIIYYVEDKFAYQISLYVLKNLVAPTIINFGIIFICYTIYRKNMSNKIKDWCAIIALSIPSCVITILHSGYPEISLTMIIPLFLSTLQNDRRMLNLLLGLFITSDIVAWILSFVTHDCSFVLATMHYLLSLAVIVCCYIATIIILNAYGDKLNKIIRYKNNEEKLNELIKLDSITGLYNNMAIKVKLHLAIEDNSNIILTMIDIDDFKKINDNYGHIVGDEVIFYLANELKKISSPQIISSRYGGDEFLIVFIDHEVEVVKQIIKKIIYNFQVYFSNKNITLSCGIASYDNSIKNEIDFINKADDALYYVKNNGKNNIKTNL